MARKHTHRVLWDPEWDVKGALFLGWGCGGITQCKICKKYLYAVYKEPEDWSKPAEEIQVIELPDLLLAMYLLYKAS
jgi:hypothetical protein